MRCVPVALSAVVLAAVASARAQDAAPGRAVPDRFWSFPSGTVAYWAMDPSRFGRGQGVDPQRRLVESLLRAAVSSGIVQDEQAVSVLSAGLAASVVGAVPHRLVVLDFAAHRRDDPDGGMAIDRLQMVLELETAAGHAEYLRTVRSIVVEPGRDAEGRAKGVQRALTLPGSVRGVAYAEPDWPRWREVSWASTDGAFLIGLGRDALSAWLSRRGEGDPHGQWLNHRRVVEGGKGGDAGAFFEAYVDIDALRRGFPEAFADSRAGRLFRAWSLINARSFMVHGRWVEPADVTLIDGEPGQAYQGPPMLAMDVSWSARSRLPADVRSMPVSVPAWPAGDLAMAPPPGRYVIAIPMDYDRILSLGLNSYQAGQRPWDGLSFEIRRKRWFREHGDAMEHLLRSFKGWVILSDVPRPPVAAPGVTTIFAELDQPADRARFTRDMTGVLTSLSDHVSYDRDRGLWMFSAGSDPNGWLRFLTWGLGGPRDDPVLIGGWSPTVVQQNRRRMTGDDAKRK